MKLQCIIDLEKLRGDPWEMYRSDNICLTYINEIRDIIPVVMTRHTQWSIPVNLNNTPS